MRVKRGIFLPLGSRRGVPLADLQPILSKMRTTIISSVYEEKNSPVVQGRGPPELFSLPGYSVVNKCRHERHRHKEGKRLRWHFYGPFVWAKGAVLTWGPPHPAGGQDEQQSLVPRSMMSARDKCSWSEPRSARWPPINFNFVRLHSFTRTACSLYRQQITRLPRALSPKPSSRLI